MEEAFLQLCKQRISEKNVLENKKNKKECHFEIHTIHLIEVRCPDQTELKKEKRTNQLVDMVLTASERVQ